MARACNRKECTVVQTGRCLLNNDPETCPERFQEQAETGSPESATGPVLEQPPVKPKFPSSLALGFDGAHRLMVNRYCRVIGILGAPDAGKTAVLVSLYLLVAKNQLDGFEFGDSRTLMALEEISQGSRRWNEGQPPEQMTAHTELTDDRTAGFIHLRLRERSSGASFDFLLPDLPGEWSTSLIDTNRVDRLVFLRSADAIWLMVDGEQLSSAKTRQFTVHRTKLLIQRTAALFGRRKPALIVAVTRRDRATPSGATIDELVLEAQRHGMSVKVVSVASFADGVETIPGAGILDLVLRTIEVEPDRTLPVWPDTKDRSADRAVLRFRS